MKKILMTLAIITSIAVHYSRAQSTNCGTAVERLQAYASQVNQIYSNEYWTIIPSQRCPAYDQFGRTFHPAVVQNCRMQMLAYLNNWYGQQCNYVNNSYAQIVRGCSVEQPSNIRRPAPGKKSGSEENEEIDTDEIEDLTAGIDEDKTVRITIPKTASGFRGRQ